MCWYFEWTGTIFWTIAGFNSRNSKPDNVASNEQRVATTSKTIVQAL